MAFSQPTNIYICNQDGLEYNGGGIFDITIPQGVQNCTSVDVAEFSMYDLMNVWRNGCYFYFTVGGAQRAVPMPSGVVTNMTEFLALLNFNLAADGYPNTYNFSYNAATRKLRFNFPAGIVVVIQGWGTTIPGYGDPYVTSVAKWIGMGETDVAPIGANAYVDMPLYPKLLRTTAFYVHCSLNSADSIVANSNSAQFPDTSTMAKIINDSQGFGGLIYYQASLEDRVSKDAVGTSVYFLRFQLLDDDHVPMSDIPVDTFIHMTLRCSYGK